MNDLSTDVLIVGAGPAGFSAAIYTARAGKKTLVIAGKSKSHLGLAHLIENYPGVEPLTGPELIYKMEAQAKKFGAQILSADAIALSLGNDLKMVSTRNEMITAQVVILAMGKGEHKKTLQNEENYLGAGLSYCAVCDGSFYRGKKVIVYGGDHEAIEDAQYLQQLGCDTTLLLYCRDTHCPDELLETASGRGVKIIPDTEITQINGNGTVQSVTIRNKNGESTLETSGLFIIQAVPSLPLLTVAGVHLTNKDCIEVNRRMETNLPGVFAAGDITCGGVQAAIASGEGIVAALSALKYLRSIT